MCCTQSCASCLLPTCVRSSAVRSLSLHCRSAQRRASSASSLTTAPLRMAGRYMPHCRRHMATRGPHGNEGSPSCALSLRGGVAASVRARLTCCYSHAGCAGCSPVGQCGRQHAGLVWLASGARAPPVVRRPCHPLCPPAVPTHRSCTRDTRACHWCVLGHRHGAVKDASVGRGDASDVAPGGLRHVWKQWRAEWGDSNHRRASGWMPDPRWQRRGAGRGGEWEWGLGGRLPDHRSVDSRRVRWWSWWWKRREFISGCGRRQRRARRLQPAPLRGRR